MLRGNSSSCLLSRPQSEKSWNAISSIIRLAANTRTGPDVQRAAGAGCEGFDERRQPRVRDLDPAIRPAPPEAGRAILHVLKHEGGPPGQVGAQAVEEARRARVVRPTWPTRPAGSRIK